MYKLHYISTVLFSAVYMHLNVWHSAASNEESENWLDAPITVQHTILLDLTSCEVMGGTGGPGSHLSF